LKNYDEIMKDMLSSVSTNVDKDQGSVLWDAISPCAIELSKMYIELDDVYKLSFIKTSEGNYLTDLCFQFGVYRLQATKSIRSCIFALEIELGTRFSVENSELNFVLIEPNRLECETAGSEGNKVEGRLLPIEHIDGFTNAFIGEVIIVGEDEETDENLQLRALTHITRPQQDGNIDQYLKWASEFVGIGNATVLPLWNGNNTVKVIITDAEGNTASSELVNNFQLFLDPEIKGLGEGVAPIGAFVTVESATAQQINISITVNKKNSSSLNSVKDAVIKIVSEYLKEATREKLFKKYEVMKRVDDLDSIISVNYMNGDDLILLDIDAVFTLGIVEVFESV
jgi:uncharacterized phage protein gp47/JayE